MKKIFSTSIALLLFISNLGLAMNTHFCGGEAVETSVTLGLDNLNCGMASMEEPCENNQQQVKSEACCDNTHNILQIDEDYEFNSAQINLNPIFITALIHSFVQPLIFSEQKHIQYKAYEPPIPNKDVQVLFQTFLI